MDSLLKEIKDNSNILWENCVLDKIEYCKTNKNRNKVSAYLRKIDYCLQDIFHELNLNDRRNLIILSIYLDWVFRATKFIRKIVYSNFNLKKEYDIDISKIEDFVSLFRTIIYAHPLNVDGKYYSANNDDYKLSHGIEPDQYIFIDIIKEGNALTNAAPHIYKNSNNFYLSAEKGFPHYNNEVVDFWICTYDVENDFEDSNFDDIEGYMGPVWTKYVGVSVKEIFNTINKLILYLIALNDTLVKNKRK